MALKLGSYLAAFRGSLSVSEDRLGLFPMPTALVARQVVAPEPMSSLAIRLFHALLYLSWNLMAKGALDLPCSAKALRQLIGRGMQESNSDLEAAFTTLLSTAIEVPLRCEQTCLTTTTILQSYRHDRETYWWRFSDEVSVWCSGSGMAYGWLDIRNSCRLRTTAALRLYELGSVLARRTEKPSVKTQLPALRTFLNSRSKSESESKSKSKSKYERPSDFVSKLVEPAIRSVNGIAGFECTFEKRELAHIRSEILWTLSVRPIKRDENLSPVPGPLCRDDLEFLAGDDIIEEAA